MASGFMIIMNVGKGIRTTLNFDTLENDLIILGEYIRNKYLDINPSSEFINKFTSVLTSGLYSCCTDNYIRVDHNRCEPVQQNCNSENFKAITEAHKGPYLNLTGVNSHLVSYHKSEWLFYQGIPWQKRKRRNNQT